MGITNALVVDDSRLARLTLTRLLEKRSIRVEKASSAREAFETLKGQRPDLILMDVTMPDIDGLEATRMITNNPETASIPVVMCTAEDSDEARNKAQACGATAFLTKPAGGDNLDRVLAEIAQQLAAAEPVTAVTPAQPAGGQEAQDLETATTIASGIDIDTIMATAREAAQAELQASVAGTLQELAATAASSAVDALRAELQLNMAARDEASADQESQQAAHLAAIMAAEESATETVRQLSEKAVATALQKQIRVELGKATGTLTATIREELTSQLDKLLGSEQIRARLENATTRLAATEAERVASEVAPSMARSAARKTAAEVARDEARKIAAELAPAKSSNDKTAGKAKSLAVTALVVSLLTLAASAALTFLF